MLISTNKYIRDYLDELLEAKEKMALEKITGSIMSPLERKILLSEIARARLEDFLDLDGEPALRRETPNNRAAREFYHRVRYDKDGNPIITRNIKLIDPNSAIQELNKKDSSYAPSRHLVNKRVQFDINLVEKVRDITPEFEPTENILLDNNNETSEVRQLPGENTEGQNVNPDTKDS